MRYCNKCETNRKNHEYYKGNTTCIPCIKKAYQDKKNNVPAVTTPGFIYIITNPAWDGYYKLGKTINLEKRMSTYMTGSPLRDYTYLITARVSDVNRAEVKALQSLSEYYDVKGEWIVASKDTAIIKLIRDMNE